MSTVFEIDVKNSISMNLLSLMILCSRKRLYDILFLFHKSQKLVRKTNKKNYEIAMKKDLKVLFRTIFRELVVGRRQILSNISTFQWNRIFTFFVLEPVERLRRRKTIRLFTLERGIFYSQCQEDSNSDFNPFNLTARFRHESTAINNFA